MLQKEKNTYTPRFLGAVVGPILRFYIDIITGKPAASAFEFAVPPTAGILVEDVDDLACAKRKASGGLLLRGIIMHGKDIFVFRGGVCERNREGD
jgi:hypothetical protein